MVKRRERFRSGLALLLGAAGLVACQHSRVAEHWGLAQRENVARMVQNPEAEAAEASAVEGLDALTGEAVVGKYEREQSESRDGSQLPSIIQIESGSE